MDPAPAAQPFPRPYGRYELLERIGDGGMAEVFKARLAGVAGFQKILVIKRILPHLAHKSRIVDMFLSEAKIAAEVQHRNVVQVFDLGRLPSGEYYMAMEYVEGTDLRALLGDATRAELRIPPWLSVHIITEALEGLEHAHSLRDQDNRVRNLVHRDVTPSNVFISRLGEVKLGDFGIARDDTIESKTRTGQLKGKVAYMAPEQLVGSNLDRRTDVFAAAVVLWECLTQRRLFGGRPEFEAMKLICQAERPSPSQFVDDIPAVLDDVVRTALSLRPDDRYPSAQAFQEALLDVLPALHPRIRPLTVRQALEGLKPGLAAVPTPTEARPLTRSAVDESDPYLALEFADSTPGSAEDASAHTVTELASEMEVPVILGRPATPAQASPVGATALPEIEIETVAGGSLPENDRAWPSATGESQRGSYRGAFPFWIRDGRGQQLGPVDYAQTMAILSRELELSPDAPVQVSANHQDWLPAQRFLALSGQDAVLTQPDTVDLPRDGTLSGTLERRSLTSAFAALARQSATGRLHLKPVEHGRAAYFAMDWREGTPHHVESSALTLQVLSLLVSKSVVPEHLIPELVHRAALEQSPIDQITSDHLSSDISIYRPLFFKERLYECFRQQSGPFVFEPRSAREAAPPGKTAWALLPDIVARAVPEEEIDRRIRRRLDERLDPVRDFDAQLERFLLGPKQMEVARKLKKGRRIQAALKSRGADPELIQRTAYLLLECDLLLPPLR